MARSDELKALGWKRKGGLWINPLTRRGFSIDGAGNYVARQAGFKTYKDYEKLVKTPKYKRFEKFAKQVSRPTNLNSKFLKLYKEANKKKFKPGSDELDRILKYVNKRNSRSRWQAGETPKKR